MDAGGFPLRRRITGLKCVNSEVNSVSILPNGFPQVGPWHHVGATMEITLDKNLIHHRICWELNPVHAKPEKTKKLEKVQVRMAEQAMYHQGNQSVFVGGRLWTLLPPPAK